MSHIHDHSKVEKELQDKIIGILSAQIGVEPEDITLEDSFVDDLHMSPSDVTDFLTNVEKENIDVSSIDFTVITTVNEFIDEISSNHIVE